MHPRTMFRAIVTTMVLSGLLVAVAAPAAPPASPMAQALLADLGKANTLDEVAAAFRKANLSQAELQALRPQLQGPIGTKIQQLVRQQKASHKAQLSAEKNRELSAFESRKRQHLASQDQARAQGNQEVQAALARSRSAASGLQTRMNALAAPPRPTPDTGGATITAVRPAPAVVGQSLTISGSGFGTSRGQALVLLGPRDRFTCEVTQWSDTRVVATVPLAAESLVRAGRQPGLVRILLAGRDIGPFYEIEVGPDPARLTPEVTATTPARLRAMQTFIIDGRNFGPTAGDAVLQFRGGRIAGGDPAPDLDVDLQIDEWHDTYIVATLRWEADLRESQAVRLVVTNDLGRSGSKSLEFVQEKEQYRLVRGLDRVHCELWDSHDDEPSWVCLSGTKETQRFSWGRCPGGTVLYHGVTKVDEGGLNYGCRMIERPTGVNWAGSVELFADLYSWVDCEAWIVVEAVRGHECH